MSTIQNSFEGKTVFITGSSRGLGKTFARSFCEAGAKVILHGRDEKRLEQTTTEFRQAGYDVKSIAFDITDMRAVQIGVDQIEKNIGPIDILMNNAGRNIRDHFLTMSFENFDTVMKTNLYSIFYVGQAVAKHMVKRKEGKIINICSLLSEVARPGIPAYATSKGAAKMLTKAMAVDLAEFNIQVNGIAPGYFATEMNTPLVENKEFDSWLRNRTPQNRWGDEIELTEAARFLAGVGTSYMTGQVLIIDGGILSSL